jgi:hypothetical protein
MFSKSRIQYDINGNHVGVDMNPFSLLAAREAV